MLMGMIVFAQNSSSLDRNSRNITSAQPVTLQPGLTLPDYPTLELPSSYDSKSLPYKWDNSGQPYLRPVFSQQGASCGQSAFVAYNFCYEINRLRHLSSNVPENQYPSHFTWNFMNASTYYGVGVSYFHSMEILRSLGCPNEATFGPITMDDPYVWMSGYHKYYSAMHNRIREVKSIPVGTSRGLLTLKNWLIDHLEGSPVGGIANFYTGITNYLMLPGNSPEAGKKVITSWYPEATHALTIVGYNDSIRYDVNGDGQFTNDIDINSDGAVDMKDWEIGGVKFVNSYGESWADSGFCYALYSSLAKRYGDGGIWNNSAHVIIPDTGYSPLLTLKATISHNARGMLRIRAGVNTDTSSYFPSEILEFPVFNYQGGNYFMQGGDSEEDKEIEIGLDITPLLGALNSQGSARFYLLIDENDPDNTGVGLVRHFSVIRYDGEEREYVSWDAPFNILDNNTTCISVLVPEPFTQMEINPPHLNAAIPGQPYQQQITVSGGTPPYTFGLIQEYTLQNRPETYIPGGGQKLSLTFPEDGMQAVVLPFKFPFYGNSYDTVFVHENGYLLFQSITAPYPYVQDEKLFLKQIRAISPLMNKMQGANAPEDGIWYMADSTQAVFSWKVGAEVLPPEQTDEFSLTLNKNGKIRFSYGDLLATPVFATVIGLSNGDGINYQFVNSTGSDSPGSFSCVDLLPQALPPLLKISETGLLSADTVPGDQLGYVRLAVTDADHIRKTRNYPVSTGPQLTVNARAGDDSNIEPGETVTLDILAANYSTAGIEGLTLSLRSLSPCITLIDSTEAVATLSIGQQQEVKGAFSFNVSDTLSLSHLLNLEVKLNWNGHELISHLSYPTVNFTINLSGPYFPGLQFNSPKAGDSCSLVMNLFYGGDLSNSSFTGRLASDDPYVAILEPGISPFVKTTNSHILSNSWILKVNPATPKGRMIAMNIEAVSDKGDTLSKSFILKIGESSIAVIDLDGNHNSAWHIAEAITRNGIEPDLLSSVDSTIFGYDQIFLSLGMKPLNHILTNQEGETLCSFLDQGGNLYMEGGMTFGGDHVTAVHPKFRVTGEKHGWQHPADTVEGIEGTFTWGTRFKYDGDHIMMYNLKAEDPAFELYKDKNSGYHFVVANDSTTYRTIASSLEFGSTFPFNSPGREEIMARYLNFLKFDKEPLAANFTADAYSVCIDKPVEFRQNCSGRPLAYHWTFEGGTPEESTDPEVSVSWKTPGTYRVSLTISDSVASNTVVKENQVHILNCIGMEDNPLATGLVLYPNPVSDILKIAFQLPGKQRIRLQISDILGRNIRQQEFEGFLGQNLHELSVTGFRHGIYLLTLYDGQSRLSSRFIVN